MVTELVSLRRLRCPASTISQSAHRRDRLGRVQIDDALGVDLVMDQETQAGIFHQP